MKLGLQLYSLRSQFSTPELIRQGFARVAKMGYQNVQLSGIEWFDLGEMKQIIEDTGLPIVLTHVAYDRIINDTDALIEEHKALGIPVIGIGALPKEMRACTEGYLRFIDEVRPAYEKINAAGLSFAYHNHQFEFELKTPDGRPVYDLLIEGLPEMHMILDTYWITYAGCDPIEYMKKIGGKRLCNVHFKDMADDEARSICPCGKGRLDFVAITEVCRELGVQNILVEQDNATKAEDPFGEVEFSYHYLYPIVKPD